MPLTSKINNQILLVVSILALLSVFFMKRITQDECYHQFADKKSILLIDNFWNVMTNIPFLIIGSLGMFFMIKNKSHKLFFNYLVFYIAILLTSIGSAYYHLYPNSTTLIWDRLPMTVAFMSLFSIIIGDCICLKSGKKFLIPLIGLGIISIIYWQMTKSRGYEDLRLYALVQFLPILLIPIILWLYKNNSWHIITYWLMILVYLLAKVLEATDEFIYDTIILISGHSLKHLMASTAPLLLLMSQIKFNRLKQNEI